MALETMYDVISVQSLMVTVRQIPSGSQMVACRLLLTCAMDYVKENKRKLEQSSNGAKKLLNDVIEYLLSEKPYSEYSWELFFMRRMVSFPAGQGAQSDREDVFMEPPPLTQLTLTVNNECTDEQVRQLEKDLKGSDWKVTASRQAVVLLSFGLSFPITVFQSLYKHQRDGMEWITKRYYKKIGGTKWEWVKRDKY